MNNENRRKNVISRQPVKRGWFLSYLLVFAVPLVLCLGIYQVSYQSIEAESEKNYSASLRQISSEFDNLQGEIRQIQSQILMYDKVQSVTRIRGIATPEQQLDLVDATNKLNQMKLTYSGIEHMFLFLTNPDAVVSHGGYMSFDLFCSIYYPDSNLTTSQLRQYLTKRHSSNDFLKINNGNKQSFLFPLTTIDNTYGKDDGTIVVSVSQETLNERLSTFQWDPALELDILHPSGTIIASTVRQSAYPLAFGSLKEKSTFHYYTIHGQVTGMLAKPSQVSTWRYVLLAPVSMLNQSAREIQFYALGGLAICMLVGIALAMQLTKQHYHPLASMIQKFKVREPAIPSEKNEFNQLEHYLQSFLEKTGNTEHALYNSQQALFKYQLYGLLERPYDAAYDSAEVGTSDMQIQLPGPKYLVVLFTHSPLPQNGSQDYLQENIVQFAISNIYQEIAGEHVPVALTNAGKYVAAIISAMDDSSSEIIQNDILFTLQKVQEILHISASAAVGDLHPEKPGIHHSYLEALEAIGYCSEEDTLVLYRDIRDARGGYVFSLDDEQKLSDLVAAGKTEAATALIKQIYKANQDKVQAVGVSRCLAHNVLSALLRGANQADINGLSIVSFVEVEHAPVKDLENRLLRMVDALCTRVNEQTSSQTPAHQLCEEIRTFILENYQDPDVNISQVGLHFNLTPAYVSGIFKKGTGLSLLGFINTVRLDKTKALLSQNYSVTKIASLTGFRDSGALIRVFKKETGLTPGQYRAIHGGEEKEPADTPV